jgi:hypothetical protein
MDLRLFALKRRFAIAVAETPGFFVGIAPPLVLF